MDMLMLEIVTIDPSHPARRVVVLEDARIKEAMASMVLHSLKTWHNEKWVNAKTSSAVH
jgi:hypothetical protein